ncbi:ATP-binding protein [Nannocystis bainbridge]|uniref:histidine kinase n=1 Tax=Nannocystis bainbridge TaxID=2995303 RepID=A0ABT5DPG0_9BACT|nr:ATP-binding protein [Nannocystis bainbridge]MDC0715544.1 ATP-binding protein [Nannocystis bainbridge]
MGSQTASRRQTVYALAIALVAGIVLLVVSQVALAWMTGEPLQRTAAVVAGLVALVQVLAVYMSARTGLVETAGRDAVRVFVIAPPAALVVAVPLLWGSVLQTTSVPALLPSLGPVLAAVWGVALALAPACMAAYQHLGGDPRPASRDEYQTALAAWCSLFASAVSSAGVLATGRILAAAAPEATSRELWPALGLAVLTGLFARAGGLFARDTGGEVLALARRLDRVNIDTAAGSRPLVITRVDRLGALQAELERLRRDLVGEHRLYKETLLQTREAAEAKAEFLAAVSHELRTPLNSICGFSQLLLEGLSTPLSDEQREDIRLIRTSGMQLLGLINDILDISMIESGELRLYFASEDPADMIDEVWRQHRPLVQETGLELRTEVPGDLPRVVCDRRRICQILNNLLSNATKFTEKGSIIIAAAFEPLHGRVLIRVTDTGIGIAPEDMEKIFQEYRQVGNLAQRKKGTGLGLAIARSIANHHSGSLEVSSSPGRGSTFTLSLPLTPPRKPTSIDMTEEAVRASQRFWNPRSSSQNGEADA